MTRVVQAGTLPAQEKTGEEENWAQVFPAFSAQARTESRMESQEKTPKKELWREDGYYTGRQEILGAAVKEPEPAYGSPEEEPEEEEKAIPAAEPMEKEPAGRRFPAPENLRLVGQAFGTYWMAEAEGVLYIVDQHAAHERILYDRIRKILEKKPLDGQILLEPEPVTLSPQEMLGLSEHGELVSYMGIEAEPFGENTVLLRCVPYIFNGPMEPEDFRAMIGLIC